MKSQIFQFLEDHTGKTSSNRVKAFLLLIVSLYVIVVQTHNNTIDHVFVGELLAISFGFKMLQNRDEIKKQENEIQLKKIELEMNQPKK